MFYSAQGKPIPGPVPPTSELVWWDGDLLREQVAPAPFGGGRGAPPPATTATTTPPPTAADTTPPSRSPTSGRATFAGPVRTIGKWNGPTLTSGIQGQIHQVADILGDWREEIVTFTNGELRIYSTTIPAKDRRVTLMQDPLYRHDVTLRTMGYPHVPQVSYYLGEK
jgi:hypothetical protein